MNEPRDEWDEDHALNMILNQMIKEVTETNEQEIYDNSSDDDWDCYGEEDEDDVDNDEDDEY
jgi:hypothetical protein